MGKAKKTVATSGGMATKGIALPPEDLLIIEDPESPFCDHHKFDPNAPDFLELVEAIKVNGVIGDIVIAPNICADGITRFAIIDGRTRVRAFKVALAELAAEGKPPPGPAGSANAMGWVECSVRDDYSQDQIAVVVSAANHNRRPLTRYEEVQSMVRLHAKFVRENVMARMTKAVATKESHRRLSIIFSKAINDIKRWLSVADKPIEVQEKFYNGEIDISQIDVLDTVPTSRQVEAAEQIAARPTPPVRASEGRAIVDAAEIPRNPNAPTSAPNYSDPGRTVEKYMRRKPVVMAAKARYQEVTANVTDPDELRAKFEDVLNFILGDDIEWLDPKKSGKSTAEATSKDKGPPTPPKRGRKNTQTKPENQPSNEPAAPEPDFPPDMVTDQSVAEDDDRYLDERDEDYIDEHEAEDDEDGEDDCSDEDADEIFDNLPE